MPDQTPLSPKIEDLKARVRLDPKSRLFVPLAEELRKVGRAEDAETVLRSGLEHHSGYLSAWISLGRCLIERGARTDATGALMNALSIDPGNVVAARMLADNYLALGEKVEAIKKLKLVRALLPSDSSVEEAIASLERELGQAPPVAPAAVAPEPAPGFQTSSSQPASDEELSGVPLLQPERSEEPELRDPATIHEEEQQEPVESMPEPGGPSETQISASRPFFLQGDEQEEEPAVAPAERMEAPEPPSFEQTNFASEATSGSVQGEETSSSAVPEGELAPFEAERTEAFPKELPATDGESDGGEEDFRDDVQVGAEISTLTMADLYARQGHVEAARDIYLRMLEKDPSNEEVKRKLDLLGDSAAASVTTPAGRRDDAVRKLESWLQKVGPR